MGAGIRALLTATLTVVLAGTATQRASARPQSPLERPPEEELFDNAQFRGELLRRGLTDLLEYYKRTRPPAPHGADAQLVHREQLLERHADPTLAPEERDAALEEASAILEVLLETDEPQRRLWQWELELGKDYLFRRAERHANDILFHGWIAAGAESLGAAAERATREFSALEAHLRRFLKSVDLMSSGEYRRAERQGTLRSAETLLPQAEYFLRWSRFYGTIAHKSVTDEDRSLLEDIVEFLEEDSLYTQIAHEQSGVQAQSLLLAGMCRRLLGDPRAYERLSQAIRVIERLPETQRQALQWAYVLSQLELVKLASESQRFAPAHDLIEHLSAWQRAQMPEDFGLALALGLQEAATFEREAEIVEGEGKRAQSQELYLRRHERLADLLNAYPEHRGDLLEILYSRIGSDADPRRLDALERNALIAGLLGDASQVIADPDLRGSLLPERATSLLNRALQVGVIALADDSALGKKLRPVALFNLAVAEYRLGKPAEAVARFLELVREYPAFDRRSTALDYAVRIAADWYGQDADRADRARLHTLIDALSTLEQVRPESDQAAYWRYFLADSLVRIGELERAVRVFADVPPSSDHYASAAYRQVATQWDLYERHRALGASTDSLRSDLLAVLDASVRCRQTLAPLLAARRGSEDHAELQALLGGAIILAAEADLEPAIDAPRRTLERLSDFEERFEDQQELIGRALRLRIVAHQRLGELEEAGSIVDVFLERAPESAGAVMDQLLRQMTDRTRRLRESGQAHADAAAEALALARKLSDWAEAHPELLGEVDPASFELRLAGALLLAGEYQEALDIAERNRQPGGRRPAVGSEDADAIYCHAEALFQLGREVEAQPLFYELWARLPEDSQTWWQALLRSLQCHLAIGTDPYRIIAEIRKLRQTSPDMGDASIRSQFDDLERACERRLLEDRNPQT